MKDREFSHKPLLTKREKEVFELLVQDKTTKEIAKELFISEKTVRNHISNVIHSNYKKGTGKYPCLYNILMSLEVANTFFWTQMKKLAPKRRSLNKMKYYCYSNA